MVNVPPPCDDEWLENELDDELDETTSLFTDDDEDTTSEFPAAPAGFPCCADATDDTMEEDDETIALWAGAAVPPDWANALATEQNVQARTAAERRGRFMMSDSTPPCFRHGIHSVWCWFSSILVRMTYDDFKSLCERRHSVRFFDDKPLSKEDIVKLLELAQLAPSVENLQPWHFHVILGKELRRQFAETSYYGDFVEGASALVVVTADLSLQNAAKQPVWNEKELEYSCVAAMTNVLLGATAMGIGSCFLSLARGKSHELLGLPRNEIVVIGMMLGHYKPGDEYADAHSRKPFEGTYTFHD